MKSPLPTRVPRSFTRRWAGRLCVLHLAIILATTAYLWLEADRGWPATLLLFGPRWVFGAILAVVLLLVLIARTKRAVASLSLAAFVVAGPLTGGRVSLPSFSAPAEESTLRLMTFNCDGKSLDRAKFAAYIHAMKPEIAMLQDSVAVIPAEDLPSGWFTAVGKHGMRAAAAQPIRLVDEFDAPVFGPARGLAKFRIERPGGDLVVIDVHLPTPRHGLQAILSRTSDAVEQLKRVIANRDQSSGLAAAWVGSPGGGTILAGDFNMPVESTIYQRDWAKFHNAFGTAGTGWGQTMFARKASVRIDHVLTDDRWTCRSIVIGPDLGSAHRPVVVTLAAGRP